MILLREISFNIVREMKLIYLSSRYSNFFNERVKIFNSGIFFPFSLFFLFYNGIDFTPPIITSSM